MFQFWGKDTGHYEVQGTGLHVWTEGSTSTDKVAEYVDTSNGSAGNVKENAPHTGTGSGSAWYGTLDEWSTNFPEATVTAFGFSLGSGVPGDYVINSITFAGTTYTFAAPVVLTGKEQCKNGGWKTSTSPAFRNQGDCVSSFASAK